MGNKNSVKQQKCFDELRFILKSFQIKYKDTEMVPKYGLTNVINSLQTDKNINWNYLEEFFRNLYRWRNDIEFIYIMSSTPSSVTKKKEMCRIFMNDTFELEKKLISIIQKFSNEKVKMFESVNLRN